VFFVIKKSVKKHQKNVIFDHFLVFFEK